jgi:hypothetical protein
MQRFLTVVGWLLVAGAAAVLLVNPFLSASVFDPLKNAVTAGVLVALALQFLKLRDPSWPNRRSVVKRMRPRLGHDRSTRPGMGEHATAPNTTIGSGRPRTSASLRIDGNQAT